MLLRAMSGPMDPAEPESVLMPAAPDTVESHANARGQSHHRGPCWHLRVMLPWGPCQSGWSVLSPGTMVTSEPRLLPRTVFGPMLLIQLGSVLMPMSHVATRDHTDAHGLGCNLWPGGCLRTMILPGSF